MGERHLSQLSKQFQNQYKNKGLSCTLYDSLSYLNQASFYELSEVEEEFGYDHLMGGGMIIPWDVSQFLAVNMYSTNSHLP
ncbi:hypothetical protein HN51_022115 [Arachis hypogaea]